MHNRRLAFLVGLVGLVIAAFFYSTVKSEHPKTETGYQNKLPTTQRSLTAREVEVYQSPRIQLTPKTEEAYSAGCRKFWQGLRGEHLQSFFNDRQSLESSLAVSRECTGVPSQISEMHDRFQGACNDFLGIKKDTPAAHVTAIRKACFASVLMYRAGLTDLQYQGTPLEQIQDPRVLADIAMSRFTSNIAQAADVADRLLELEPGLYPAAKLSAMGRFLQLKDSLGKPTENEVLKQLEHASERGQEMNPGDHAFYDEMRVGKEIFQKDNLPGVAKAVDEFAQANPDSAREAYFRAYVEYKQGNLEKSKQWMKTAAEREPQYQGLYERMQEVKPGTDPGVFYSSQSLPLDELIPNP